MTEPKERREYREECKNYGIEGYCYFLSSALSWGKKVWVDINCTPDADCARMMKYDKLNHNDDEKL